MKIYVFFHSYKISIVYVNSYPTKKLAMLKHYSIPLTSIKQWFLCLKHDRHGLCTIMSDDREYLLQKQKCLEQVIRHFIFDRIKFRPQ